jgi:uncharacterized protein YdhG (YjbR/CyaY superfamily)
MANTIQDVDAYIEKQSAERQIALRQIRTLILDTVPDSRETMRYRMPTYELDQVVCAFASQKNYISLYMDVGLVKAHANELGHLDVGKSCIRFKKIEALPMDTVRQILIATVKEQKELDAP